MSSQQLPFVFIHGAGGTRQKWRRVSPLLPAEEVILLDLPQHVLGQANLQHGEQEAPCGSVSEFADRLCAQVAKQECILVGHSLGGLIALELAARLSTVRGLVLAMSHYQLPVHPAVSTSLENGVYPPFLFRASYSKSVNPLLLAEEEAQLDWLSTEIIQADFSACQTYQGERTLSRITVPLLAIYGAEDKLLPEGAQQQLLTSKPEANIEQIQQAGHFAILEQPERFVEALQRFRNNLTSKKNIPKEIV